MVGKPIEIDCEEVWRHISDYLDDEVNSDLRAVLKSHFKGCAHCSAVLDGARNVLQLVGDGKAFEISAKTSTKFYTKLDRYLTTRPRKS